MEPEGEPYLDPLDVVRFLGYLGSRRIGFRV